jgi:hypothetical protein
MMREAAGPGHRHPARPEFQRQDRRLSAHPARDRRPRSVLDRDRHARSQGAGLYPLAEPAPDLLLRDADRPAAVPALLPEPGDRRRHHRHAVERRVAVDEDRGGRRGLRSQRRLPQLLRPPVHDDERAFLRGGAEPAHHGDRHRPHFVGPRAVHTCAGDTRTATSSCRIGRAGAPSRTRRRSRYPPAPAGMIPTVGRRAHRPP